MGLLADAFYVVYLVKQENVGKYVIKLWYHRNFGFKIQFYSKFEFYMLVEQNKHSETNKNMNHNRHALENKKIACLITHKQMFHLQ